jgi:5-formyltetrahydrofolate cyclo-ligase
MTSRRGERPEIDPQIGPGRGGVRAWRKRARATLIECRAAVAEAQRKAWNARITARLLAAFVVPDGAVVGLCWPYRGEFDARLAARQWRAQGALTALPEVVERGRPLQFRQWWPGAPMRAGVYDIPVPHGTAVVIPDIVLAPMNAFDASGYRLGYGGGFFDRTLAAHDRRMLSIGVAYEMLRVPTIHPQDYDVPMDFVVTEEAVYGAGGEPLIVLSEVQAQLRAQELLAERRLPRACHAP